MHIFKYSKRKGTKAAVMADQVPEDIKTKRSGRLLELEKEMSEEFREFYLGRTKEALLEEEMELDGMRYFTGYTKEYVKVAVRADGHAANTMVRGRMERELSDGLYLMVEF